MTSFAETEEICARAGSNWALVSHESCQTLEQAFWRDRWCPMLVSVQDYSVICFNFGESWSGQAVGLDVFCWFLTTEKTNILG